MRKIIENKVSATLKSTEKLEQSGLPHEQTQTLSMFIGDVINMTFDHFAEHVDRRFEHLELRLDAQDTKIEALDKKIDQKTDILDMKIDVRTDALQNDITTLKWAMGIGAVLFFSLQITMLTVMLRYIAP